MKRTLKREFGLMSKMAKTVMNLSPGLCLNTRILVPTVPVRFAPYFTTGCLFIWLLRFRRFIIVPHKGLLEFCAFTEMGGLGKVKRDALFFVKIILLLGFLYFFICSLDFLRSIFRLLGGKNSGEAFASNKILSTTAFRLLGGKTAGEAFASNKILSNSEDFIGCKRKRSVCIQ